MPARQRGTKRGGFGLWLRRLVLLGLLIALLPLVLTVVYVIPQMRPVSTLMLADLVTGRGYQRQWLPIDQVAPVLRAGVIMSEDGQFCSHHGIDFAGLKTVIDKTMDGRTTRGASTIPMQAAKNLYLWPGRSFVRKALEAPLALWLDAVLPKKRLLEIYLNIVEWGPGIYGAEAAAQHHFGRSARELTRRQAALLAVALPNPIARNPAKPSAVLNRLAALIERRIAQSGDHVDCVR